MKHKCSQQLRRAIQRILDKAEQESNDLLAQFPYFVATPESRRLLSAHPNGPQMREYETNIEQWLKENLPEGSYLAYPAIMAKQKDKSNGVNFKRKSDAMLFKLSCI